MWTALDLDRQTTTLEMSQPRSWRGYNIPNVGKFSACCWLVLEKCITCRWTGGVCGATPCPSFPEHVPSVCVSIPTPRILQEKENCKSSSQISFFVSCPTWFDGILLPMNFAGWNSTSICQCSLWVIDWKPKHVSNWRHPTRRDTQCFFFFLFFLAFSLFFKCRNCCQLQELDTRVVKSDDVLFLSSFFSLYFWRLFSLPLLSSLFFFFSCPAGWRQPYSLGALVQIRWSHGHAGHQRRKRRIPFLSLLPARIFPLFISRRPSLFLSLPSLG